MKILVTPTSFQPGKAGPALERLRSFSEDLRFNPAGRPLTEEELIPLLQGCEGYLAGLDSISSRVLEAAPGLKVVSRYGAGVDRVDLEAARRLGIVVSNTPAVNADAVAELAMGLMLSLARRIPYLDRSTRAGGWVRSQGMELKGKWLGIIGLGAIGQRLARIAQGFGMYVQAYDPYMNQAYADGHGIKTATLTSLIQSSDVLSLHVPLNEQTRHLFSAERFAQMKPTALLINTSRGGLIDEDAAYEALKEGRLAALALDAFEKEPPVTSPLFSLDNVVLTPHTGAHTKEAAAGMADCAVDNLIRILSGEHCDHIVR